jgi:hypothetical protein
MGRGHSGVPDAGAESVSAISDADENERCFAQNSARDVLLLRRRRPLPQPRYRRPPAARDRSPRRCAHPCQYRGRDAVPAAVRRQEVGRRAAVGATIEFVELLSPMRAGRGTEPPPPPAKPSAAFARSSASSGAPRFRGSDRDSFAESCQADFSDRPRINHFTM